MRLSCFDRQFFEGLDQFVGAGSAENFRASIQVAHEIPRILEALNGFAKLFDAALRRAMKPIRNVERKGDGSLPRISGQGTKDIDEAVKEIRDLTSRADDMVNDIDVERLKLKEKVVVFFSQFDGLLPDDDKPCFRLDELRQIAQIQADAERGRVFSIVAKYRRHIRFFQDELLTFNIGINDFNAWVHDMGHYLVQLDRRLPCRCENGVQILESDLQVIDALLSGIKLLETGLMMSLTGDESVGIIESEHQSHPYEPYKVFHKLRYMYSERGILWNNGDVEFWGKVAPARGIEFAAMNLYANAVKYLSQYPGEKVISTLFIQKDDGLEIKVESYGPMPTEEEERRISNETPFRAEVAYGYKGSGRGLCRVRRICEEAGYKFEIRVIRDKIKYRTYAPFAAVIFIPKIYQIA